MRDDDMTHRVDQPILKGAFSDPVITWIFFKNRWVKKSGEKAFRELVRRGDAISVCITFCALATFLRLPESLVYSQMNQDFVIAPDRKTVSPSGRH